ncbi:MAG: glycosyltransferase family 4 protein [Sphingomonas bacterium]
MVHSGAASTAISPGGVCLYTRSWRTAGAGLFAQELAKGLIEQGVGVIFVSPRTDFSFLETDQDALVRLRPPRELGPGSAKPRRAIVSIGRMIGSALSLLRARLSTRVFIITIPDPLIIAIPVLFLLRLTGAKLIVIAHDPLPHAWMLPARLRVFERGAHSLFFRTASVIVVLSEPTRTQFIAAHPGISAPVHVIEHGVFTMKTFSPPPGTGQLLLFGTIRRNKNVLGAIAGAAAARRSGVPVRLIVAGEAHREEAEYAAACAHLAAQHREAVSLRMHYVEDDELAELFAESDALLMPYGDFHSQSGVALLAASNARPIIATNAGGIGALIAEGMPAITIAQPAGPEEISAAIRAFYDQPIESWQSRAVQYREVTLERRSWRSIAGEYAALAKSLAT